MESVENAIQLIKENVDRHPVVKEKLEDCLGHSLAIDLISPINMPPFSQSAMDGYAVAGKQLEYSVIGEIKAGDDAGSIALKSGEAVRIFTGGMIPKGADFVIIQEHVSVKEKDNKITVPLDYVHKTNIRPLGEQLKKGEVATKKGTTLTPGLIGFLTTLGIVEVEVYRKPTFSIIATGNELTEAGKTLAPGKIYESNALMLKMALQSYGFSANTYRVADDLQQTLKTVEKAINNSDVVFLSGGISVGKYDFVHEVLEQLGVEEIFYKVRQKPGKPLYFGQKKNTVVFGLPGNPAAALTSFYVYGLVAIAQKMGRKVDFLKEEEKQLTEAIEKPAGRTFFLKGKVNGNEVEILSGQSSAMLSAFSATDCFILLNQEATHWEKGATVKVLNLQY